MLRRIVRLASISAVAASAVWLGPPRCAEHGRLSPPVVARECEVTVSATPDERHLVEALTDAAPAAGAITVDYPAEDTVFPPDLAPPTFLWHDQASRADRWLASVTFEGDPARIDLLVEGPPPPRGRIDPRTVAVTNEIYEPTAHQASAHSWKPSPEVWRAIQRHSVATEATLTLTGFRDGAPPEVLSTGRTRFTTSRDPVGAPIFYRDVPLMPSKGKDGVIKPLDQSSLPLISWRLKDVSREDSRVLLDDMPTCANCHSFSADGGTLGMDVDGPDGDKGAYAIAPIERRTVIANENVITWNAFPGRPEGKVIFGFLSRISPGGRYVVSTVNEALYVRNFTDFRFLQVFYPTRGILAFLDRRTGDIRALPGADDPAHVHCNAVWTPDGETIVFCRAKARDPYERGRPVATHANDPAETPIRYDLWRIPFHGGRGGTARPIPGASDNGMSNSFPKISPDGKWLVWVQARNGLLMRPDGKLWIMPVAGGEPRLMRCNTDRMNSWHSFSPNGRWLVFSSKSRTPYTQMFLTHIDEDGNDSPAVLVENATAANRAVNIPEFVNVNYDRFREIDVPAVTYRAHLDVGNDLVKQGRLDEARAELEQALEGRADWRISDWRVHDSLSKVLLRMGETDRALEHIRESLRLNPGNADAHGNLGYILFERGELAQARRHLNVMVGLSPEDPQARFNRGSLRLTLGDQEGAAEDFTAAIELDPGFAAAHAARGKIRLSRGDVDGAEADLERALAVAAPDHPHREAFDKLLQEIRRAKTEGSR